MLKYFISTLLLINCLEAISQENKPVDTIPLKTKYGLKIGIDISKQIRMLTEPDYKGLVLVADYRVLDKLFLVAELGNEEKRVTNEVLDFKTDGSFLKMGINYNIYNNSKGLNNEIYVGFRYGLGDFNHKLNSYTIYNLDQYWNQNSVNESSNFTGLSASWIEFVFGFKAEIINNIFIGLDLRLNRLMNQDKPTNFSNLYIPGYNKVLEENNFGVGISYSISYQIPFFKK